MRRITYIMHKVIVFCTILFTICACQESYDEDYLTGSLKLPVVQGYINDGPGPYKIYLSWSSSFKKYSNSPIYGAKVTISDNAGNSELLKETNNGNYVTKASGIRGIVGRKYKLSIKMTDNRLLESPAITLEPAAKIDTMYAIAGEKEFFEKTQLEEIITNKKSGLYIYVDLKMGSGDTKYLRFDNTYIWQYTRILKSSAPNPPTYYYRSVQKVTDLPDVKASIFHNNNQEIIKQPIGFLPYVPDLSDGNDTLTAYSNAGWIMCSTVSTISQSAFEYYGNVTKQLKAGAKIFDPVPSQITGNIKCKSDSSYIVLGLFDVYSQTAKYTAFLWYSSSSIPYKSKNIIDPGPIENELSIGAPFPYWVTFY